MDEYEYMLYKGGKYNIQSFNNRQNLTNTVGFFNNRVTGVSPKNVDSESRLFNIDQKNTKNQTKKMNPFFPEMHIYDSKVDSRFEPRWSRDIKSCNPISERSYITNLFQPNMIDAQKTVQYNNYIGKNTRFERR